MTEITVENGNPNYFSYEGVVYNKNNNTICVCPEGKDYIVPDFVQILELPKCKSIYAPENNNIQQILLTSGGKFTESIVINDNKSSTPIKIKKEKNSYNALGNCKLLKKLILPKKSEINITIQLFSNSNDVITFYPLEELQVPQLNDIVFYKNSDLSFENAVNIGQKRNDYSHYYFLPKTLKKLTITQQTELISVPYNFKWTGELNFLKPITQISPETSFANSGIKMISFDFNSNQKLENNMFYNCESLKKVSFYTSGDSLTIGKIFYCCNLDSVIIKNSPISNIILENHIFSSCNNLKYLELPFAGAGTALSPSNFGELFGTVKNDNMRAVTQFFEDGTNKTYYLPTSLEELTLNEGCEMIPYGGLYNCNMLKTLTLPTSLYMVGEKALYGCAKITDIYCKGADPAVAYDNSFDGMRLTSCKLHVPHISSERYKISDGWKRFYYIEEEAPLMISIAKSIENAGVVYGINEYQPGQVAEIEAVAHSGYTFVGWYENGNLLTTDSKYTLMVTESHSLVAMFTPVLDENEIEVKPSDENVTLSWEPDPKASYYSINIYSDASMTIEVGNVVVDNNGQPVSRSASSSIATTIDGLLEMQNYYYSITAFGNDDAILSKYIGTFSTSAGIAETFNDNKAIEVARYDIYGRRLDAPTKGINIVKYSDGTTRKECVKK